MRKKKITVCSAIQVGRGEVLESRHLLTGIPFSEPLSISAPQESFTGQVEDLALTDLDRDGDLDVLMVRVTADQQGESIWHLNDGDGNFTEATRRNLGSVDSQNLTLADINGDGAVDIVARQSKLVWYENTGAENSVFAEEAQDLIPTEQQVDLTSLLSISDFDNDGLNDLLMLKYLGGQDLQFVWMENLGDDGFESHPLSGALVPRYTSSNAVLARDVDVDGDLDIVVNNGEVASYFENTIDEGNGFTDPVVMKFEDSGIDITYLETTDVDHDGDEDLLVFDRAGGRVVDGEFIQNSGIVYWAENSAGTFAEPRKLEEFDVGEQVVTPHSTLIRMDIDGDGFVEPVMVNRYASRELLYYTNAQQGMLQRHSQNDSPHQGDVGDIDGDGDLDWVYSNHRGNRVLWLDSVGPDVSENVVAKTDLFEPGELAVLDFDADGDNDAVLLSDLELKWYENTGEGQFAPIVALGVRPDYYLRLVDFNGDARPDVFYSVYDESKEATSFVWKANLETGLSVPQELTIDVFPRSLADIDGDGDLDIIGRRSGEAGHVAYLNDGSGVFDESITLPFESERGLFVVTDSDGDGDMDIITDEDTRVSIYENDGNGQYSSRGLSDAVDHPLFPGTPLGYQAVRLEDMDSDGDEDLVLLYRGFNSTLAGTSNHLEIFENQGGEFALVFETNIRQNQSVRGLQFADLDGDEDLEIITHSGGTAYLENLGGLQFEAAREIEIGDPFATATEIRIADMDGDERSDVVFIPSGEDRLRVITNEIESGRQVFSDVDIDNVHAAIREESSDPALDWNNDGAVDVGDVDLLLEEMGNIRGDADLDGEVGFRDFLIVQESYGMSEVGWARGDFDGNGEVDFADFLYVRENFGHPNL